MKLHIRQIFLGIALLPIALFALLFIYIILSHIIFGILGYPIDIAPDVLATKIVREKLSPKLCNKLRQSLPSMGPSVVEKRGMCIAGVAALAKDPSACELLMPSSYGLSCVGGASRSPICGINPGFEVQWHEGDKIKRSSLKDCQKKDNRSTRGDECCIVATVSAIRTFNNCSSLANDAPVYNDCLQELSFKNHDPTTCEGISEPNLKVACIVRAKAMKQDPSICTGCTPLLEKLEDIK